MGRFIHLEFGWFVDMKFFSSIKPSGSMGIIVVRQLYTVWCEFMRPKTDDDIKEKVKSEKLLKSMFIKHVRWA